jgi:hypothetical protein
MFLMIFGYLDGIIRKQGLVGIRSKNNMNSIDELIKGLFAQNNNAAFQCLKDLETASEQDNSVYQYFDVFAEMLGDDNSFIRSRGMLLISANAKWDTDNKIDGIINKYLRLTSDDKPIVARQCIKTLPNISKHKPDLISDIIYALRKATLHRQYTDSMQPLVDKDIDAAIKAITGS